MKLVFSRFAKLTDKCAGPQDETGILEPFKIVSYNPDFEVCIELMYSQTCLKQTRKGRAITGTCLVQVNDHCKCCLGI